MPYVTRLIIGVASLLATAATLSLAVSPSFGAELAPRSVTARLHALESTSLYVPADLHRSTVATASSCHRQTSPDLAAMPYDRCHAIATSRALGEAQVITATEAARRIAATNTKIEMFSLQE